MRRKTVSGVIFVIAGTVLLAASLAGLALNGCMALRASTPVMQPQGPGVEQSQADDPVDWAYWKSVNEDVVAWISIPGTSVSQPVVQAPKSDPQYYLSHDAYGEWSLYGCPYIDAGCPRGVDSPNVVLTGHNISFPPAMFHDLELFHDETFASTHREVILYVPGGTRHYVLAGVDTVDGSAGKKRVSFDDPADFIRYRDECLDDCRIRFDCGAECGNMLTLCTCSYFVNPFDERTLLFAVR